MNISTKLLAGFGLLAVLFLAVTVASYQLAGRVLTISQRVSQSQYVSSRGNLLYRQMIDMETGYRGYLLTGREETLQPYYSGQRRIGDLLDELEGLVGERSPQRRRIRHVREQFNYWQAFSKLLIIEKRAYLRGHPSHSGLDGLPHGDMMRQLTGKRMMDRVRGKLNEFYAHESTRRQSQSEKLSEAITNTRSTSILLTITGLGLGLIVAFYVTRLLSERIRRQVQWAERLAAGEYTARMQDTEGDELTDLSTSLDRMADQMTTAIAQLQARNRELDQFAYIVSHDLKAPLRGIESVSRWIEEDMGADLPPHIQEFLALMRRRVGRMEHLISGILAFSRVGRVAETEERVDVAELLADTIEDVAPPAGFRVQLPAQLPVLFTNRTALGQVFSNLLSNAVKYHHHPTTGTATLTWRATAQHHTFTLTDDGPGIAPQYHERIFQIFQTLQERDTVESTGVGLAIVKKIVERVGGAVSVASDEGRGAAFTFTWPHK
ncbi:MAG: CHASE3 domain-containing protein [Hymenobacteraceae bacterium]|nr:CHASE3 domain-containing protein [Hymenobacteraceae bacterium]